jgi:predicted DNA-binding transcriptional regulator AlpA
MMKDLIPQKRVMAELNISRSSLWRAIQSDIEGFPAPTIVRSRLYWRPSELPALRAALDQFRGRKAFEQNRRHARAVAARAEATGLLAKTRKAKPAVAQPDLFGEADAPAPQGAEPIKSQCRGRSPSHD